MVLGLVKNALDKSTTYLGNFVPFKMHLLTKFDVFSNSVISVCFMIFRGSNGLCNIFWFRILTTRNLTSTGGDRKVNIIDMWGFRNILIFFPDWGHIWTILSSYSDLGNQIPVEFILNTHAEMMINLNSLCTLRLIVSELVKLHFNLHKKYFLYSWVNWLQDGYSYNFLITCTGRLIVEELPRY